MTLFLWYLTCLTCPIEKWINSNASCTSCSYWLEGLQHYDTMETLYSMIYYSKYFIELNVAKSTKYVALWTHKRHPIPRPFGSVFYEYFNRNWSCYKGFLLYPLVSWSRYLHSHWCVLFQIMWTCPAWSWDCPLISAARCRQMPIGSANWRQHRMSSSAKRSSSRYGIR